MTTSNQEQNIRARHPPGLQAKEAEKERFFTLAGKLTETKDPKERKRLREELAVMTFGT